ncbi:MAG: DNA-binding response regulator [Nocardioidaceae bacterium]
MTETAGPLSAFGIDAGAERVYRLVLRHSGESLELLADRAGRPVESVQADVNALVQIGLVSAAGDTVVGRSPERSLGRLVNEESSRLVEAEDALTTARLEVHTYVAEHLAGQRAERQPISLDLIPTAEIADLMQTLTANSTGELLFLRPDQWLLPSGKQMDMPVARAVSQGRSSRVIYPRTIIEEGSEPVRMRAAAGERARLLPTVPSRLAIFGTDAAIVPERWGVPGANAVLVRQPGVVAACIALYEELWRHAVSAPGLGSDGEDTPQRQLLELLGRGAKDERIARMLGLSLRTVRRRVADLMAELDVDSRFQAGVEAVRRGWI